MKKLTTWRKYFDNFSKGWMIKEDSHNATPVVFMPEPLGGIKNDDGHNKHNCDAATIVSFAPEAINILRVLDSSFDESGRAGCNYGDTEYDSLSVVYGYNLALAYVKEEIAPILQATKHIQ